MHERLEYHSPRHRQAVEESDEEKEVQYVHDRLSYPPRCRSVVIDEFEEEHIKQQDKLIPRERLCPEGLTKTQRRRVQRLRYKEQH